MIIENISLEDKETVVRIDTNNQLISLNKNDEDITIPFNKISYLVHKVGQIAWQKDYVEFHSKDKTTFSIYIEQEQIKELEKFFNIRTDILIKAEPIKKNHKYWLQVSEPWDFHDKILGTIIDVNEKRIFFKSDFRISIQDVCGNVFMLRPRYSGDKCNTLPLTVNGAILLSKYEDSKTDEQLLENSKFVIIASLKKCNLFGALRIFLTKFLPYFIIIVFTIMILKAIFDLFKIFVA